MCSNCDAPDGCDCTGGSLFASCLNESGSACAVCNHVANVDADLASVTALAMPRARPRCMVITFDSLTAPSLREERS